MTKQPRYANLIPIETARHNVNKAIRSSTIALLIAALYSATTLNLTAKTATQTQASPPTFIPTPFEADSDDPATQELTNEVNQLIKELAKRSSNLTSLQALEQGLFNNPDLATAYYNLEGSEWNLIAIRRSWYPSLQINGANNSLKSNEPLLWQQNLKQTSNLNTSTTDAWNQTTNAGPGAVLNWSFFDPTRQPSINQALQSVLAQRFLFDIAARSLVLNLQTAYCKVQAEVELIRRYQWLFSLTRQALIKVERMQQLKQLSQASLDQLKTDERLQLTNLIDRYQQLLLSSNILTQLVAETPGRLVIATTPLTQEGSWSMGLNNSLQQALSMREEIKQKLALAERDRWSATRTINGYLPVFGLYGMSALINDQSQTTNNQNWTASFGINFRWNLFDGGIRAADARALKAQAASQQSSAASEQLAVSRQIMDGYASYKTAQLALKNTGNDFNLAKTTVKNTAFNVKSDSDVTTLVQTFALYKSAADRDVNAIRQYNTAIYGLYRYSALWPESALKPLEARKQDLKR